MSDIDDDIMGEFYIPSEAELLPRANELEDGLAKTSRTKTIRLKRLKFNTDIQHQIENIAGKSGVADIPLFMRWLADFATSELAFVKIKASNRELSKQSNQIQDALLYLSGKARETQDAIINLDEQTREDLCQRLSTGLRYVFDVSPDPFRVIELLKFLHLVENMAEQLGLETTSYQRETPLHFVGRLHYLWTDNVTVGRYGNKGRFIELTKLLLEVTNQPKADPKYWVNQMQKEYFGRKSF